MKKFALIISMVAFLSLQGFSQAGTFSYGLKLGPTFDWASSASTAASNQGMRAGFSFGVIIDHYYTDHIAISTGINYNYWRGQYRFTDSRMVSDFLEEARLSPVNRRIRSNYFEMPIKIKVKADVSNDWKAFAEAGVGISLNTTDKTKDEYTYYWVNHTDKSYTNSYFYQYRLIQAALNFGIGTEYQINKKFGVFVQLSFNHALTNTFTRDMERLTGTDLKTNFIGLEVGIIH